MSDWNLETARRQLAQTQLDGWLLTDFRGANPLAAEAVGGAYGYAPLVLVVAPHGRGCAPDPRLRGIDVS